ncbi:sigma 54-interacting transcriptional regulator [Archangium sp.]|uniref:sigma 54-interacting transcriptional regulator n=1 Tax=Archangium sp. TaxID=1872627 RepID=UPI002D5C0B98|nr:sigma 54-interacting transcriptional regulator [Archangium sp.]HYO59408.1 sigma 54-interacting transcriptional regulator [Archangium sp.]
MLAPLHEEGPLEARLAEVRARWEGARQEGRVAAALEGAVICALLGRRVEADSFIAQARLLTPGTLKARVELAHALVMLEAGAPARMAGALERAEVALGTRGEPAGRTLCLLLQARMLLLEGAGSAAVRAALEGVESLPTTLEGSPLAVHAHLSAAECLLASGEATAAEAWLVRSEGAPGRTGLLAARAQVLRARLALATGIPELARALLDAALPPLTRLGAPRDLALAYVAYAFAVAPDPAGVPSGWLARAQPLLMKVGTAGDLRQLRQAFRTLGRRAIDPLIQPDIASVMEALRERHARLRDILSAQRDAQGPEPLSSTPGPSPLSRVVDESLESVHLAEEALIHTLEGLVLDRERISRLVAVGQKLSALERPEELLAALPRLAMTLVRAAAVVLLEDEGVGRLTPLAREGLPAARCSERFQQVLRGENLPRLTDGGVPCVLEEPGAGLCALVPLREAERRLVLVLELAPGEAALREREEEQLAVFGSLVGAALARATASAALRQAAARDAATLAAIRDGILTLAHDGGVRALNEAAARMLRVTPAQLVGRRLQDVAALAPLAEVLGAGRPLSDEIVVLAHGEFLVRAQRYEGGVVATLQELAAAQRLAHKLVGSQARCGFEDLIGEDPVFRACLEDARRAARSDAPILITGESGTGKELLAQAIHRASLQAAAPFVGINVAAFPRELLESELFGYERGAFTGARSGGNPGKFEQADGGTLLMDEIGDMPLEMQAKLLRVLQERMLQRLGGTRTLPITARVMATTHRDLERAVMEGGFRLDLFHRLRVVHLRLPPLRERRSDIPLLVEHHLRRHATRLRRRSLRVAPAVMDALMRHAWPGNVRELANLLEGAACLLKDGEDVITRVPLAMERALPTAGAGTASRPRSLSLEEPVLPLEEVERRAFEHALHHCGGNVAQAAKALGVAKGTFYSKMRRYGLGTPPGSDALLMPLKALG